ncbi:MAG TPA: hypothetical protein PKA95_05615 [Thermomicrobiales bacterium]|nr:hypothetical protein [Thermomicrobiales bacterium]
MDELREINRLNDDWDALLRGETREVDPALLRDVMALRDATATPGPSPEFADRLWRELERGRPAPALSPRWQIPRLAIAAVLALVLLGAAVALLLRDDPAEPAGQLAAATEAPVASPTAPPIETPHVAGPTATAPPSETPQVAVVSPTPDHGGASRITDARPERDRPDRTDAACPARRRAGLRDARPVGQRRRPDRPGSRHRRGDERRRRHDAADDRRDTDHPRRRFRPAPHHRLRRVPAR